MNDDVNYFYGMSLGFAVSANITMITTPEVWLVSVINIILATISLLVGMWFRRRL